MPFSYSGDLGGLLNLAASKFNVNWEWIGDGKKIRFFKTKSKTYDLRALAGSTTFKNKVMKAGGSGSSGSGSGSSEQETGVDSSGVSVWEDITKSIEIMLSPEGSVIASQSTGKITVTDTPVFLNVIDNYIESVNETLLKQVVINVRVLAVDISDSESYGLNWDAIYSNIDKNFSVGLSSPFSQATGAADFAVNILSKGKWAGTKAFIQALSTQGDVSQVTSSSEITMNHQPVPIQVGREKSYLASSQTTLNNTVSSTTLQPDLISTGFSMNLVPNIMNNQEILLQFGADISTLINIESISSGGSTIQVPEIETRNFVQRVKLRTGDTLVVSGFEQSNLSGKRSSVGNDAFGGFFNFLGGSTVNSDSRTALVILIQPIILD